ncbi:MAG: hypothetical protein AAF242_09060 [Bacteroidota bacterium]
MKTGGKVIRLAFHTLTIPNSSSSFPVFSPEEDQDFITDADAVLKNFLQKGQEERLALAELVYKNCMDFLQAIGYDETDKALILWLISINHKIYSNYFFILANCFSIFSESIKNFSASPDK